MSSSIRNRVHTTPGKTPGSGNKEPSWNAATTVSSSPWSLDNQHRKIMEKDGRTEDESTGASSSARRRRSGSSSSVIGVTTVYPLHIQYQQDVNNSGTTTSEGATTYKYNDNMGTIRTGKLLRAEKTRLEDYHVAYRTPLHVPDNAYRAFLQGRTGKTRPTLITRVCCLHTCIGFSTVAVVFLCFIGFLINSQPLLMAGTLRKTIVEASDGSGRYSTRFILPAPGEVQPAARAAYRAAMAYFVCILLCLAGLHPGWIQSQIYRVRHRYQDIPDHASVTSTLPDFHNPNETITPHWARIFWNRCSLFVRQRLAERGWYQTGARPRRKDRKTG